MKAGISGGGDSHPIAHNQRHNCADSVSQSVKGPMRINKLHQAYMYVHLAISLRSYPQFQLAHHLLIFSGREVLSLLRCKTSAASPSGSLLSRAMPSPRRAAVAACSCQTTARMAS